MYTSEDKPDRQTIRLKGYDYSSAGFYYVTACTRDRHHAFGEIKNDSMYLNEAGKITRMQWLKLPEHFSGIKLDQFVIMPNHIHGIIIIYARTNTANVPARFQPHMQMLAEIRDPRLKTPYQPPTVGDIIRSYKASSTRLIRASGATNFAWQNKYHERIIRHSQMLQFIRIYTLTNPQNWEKDKLYTPQQ